MEHLNPFQAGPRMGGPGGARGAQPGRAGGPRPAAEPLPGATCPETRGPRMGPAHGLHSSHPEDAAGRFYLKTNTSECFLFLVTFTTSHCQIFGECGKVWEESESHLLPITHRQSLRKADSCLLARSRGRACARGTYACAVCGCVCLHGVHVCTNGVRVRACGVRARCAWRAWRAAWVVSARAPWPPRRKATRFRRSHVPAPLRTDDARQEPESSPQTTTCGEAAGSPG